MVEKYVIENFVKMQTFSDINGEITTASEEDESPFHAAVYNLNDWDLSLCLNFFHYQC